MKYLKCPMCNKGLFIYSMYKYFYYRCSCGFTTPPATRIGEAQKKAEKFITEFPPIMRVHPGDKLQYLVELDEYATVVSTDINNGKIYTDKGYCYPSGVIKWPWELEEKEPGYHENKRQLCKDAGITLIEVWDSQWKTNAETIKKEISEHLQKIREKL